VEIEQTATVKPDGSTVTTLEARVSRAEYDSADLHSRGTCDRLNGMHGKVAISSESWFEGQSYICRMTAVIHRFDRAGVPWVDVSYWAGRRKHITINPAGMVATSSFPLATPSDQVAKFLQEHRDALAGGRWKVSISGPRIEETDGIRTGQTATWDFSVLEVLEGAPIRGTVASATVAY